MFEHFGDGLATPNQDVPWWADFQRDEGEDPETGDPTPAPKVYEPIYSQERVTSKAYFYLQKFNDQYPAKAMNLVSIRPLV